MDKLKEIFSKVTSWVDSKGFSALASLGIGVGLWIFAMTSDNVMLSLCVYSSVTVICPYSLIRS